MRGCGSFALIVDTDGFGMGIDLGVAWNVIHKSIGVPTS